VHQLVSLARPDIAFEQRRDVLTDGCGHIIEAEYLIVGLFEGALVLLSARRVFRRLLALLAPCGLSHLEHRAFFLNVG
jgi:hypothetical protein